MAHDQLWAPWRMDYIRQVASQDAADADTGSCFLCEAVQVPAQDAEAMRQRLVLLSDDRGMILLNRFPYTNGHLLIAPRQHVGDLTDLSAQQRHDLMDLTVLGQRLLQAACNPQGMNVGVNLGRCAGAGLPGHVHVHIVPRWSGDTNFMQTLGQVRVIPEALEVSYAQLRSVMGGVQGSKFKVQD